MQPAISSGESEGRISGSKHNWVALVPDNFVHLKFISDLAGDDASDHDETPATVIKRVASWLSLQPDFTPPTPSAKTILGSFAPFRDLLIKFQEQSLGTLTWPAIIKATESVVAQMN